MRAAATVGQQEATFLALAETLSSLVALIQGDTLTHVNRVACSTGGR